MENIIERFYDNHFLTLFVSFGEYYPLMAIGNNGVRLSTRVIWHNKIHVDGSAAMAEGNSKSLVIAKKNMALVAMFATRQVMMKFTNAAKQSSVLSRAYMSLSPRFLFSSEKNVGSIARSGLRNTKKINDINFEQKRHPFWASILKQSLCIFEYKRQDQIITANFIESFIQNILHLVMRGARELAMLAAVRFTVQMWQQRWPNCHKRTKTIIKPHKLEEAGLETVFSWDSSRGLWL